ncbi:MAG TPA: hypothetical protein DD671_01185, partial [Balneolaceae bacterium]|nr:hypothetical protein [Balneolaceae bacterium]
MYKATQLFMGEEASQAEQITRELLSNLEQSLSTLNITEEDLSERPDFVESLFTQQTQELIAPTWERFS